MRQIVFVSLLLFAQSCMAQWGVSVASGEGYNSVVPYRAALLWNFGPIWREKCTWGLDAVWETSAAYWKGPTLENGYDNKLEAITTGPSWRWQRRTPTQLGLLPYIEAGIAPSWLSRSYIGLRRMSTHFQFQDDVGIGTRFGKKGRYDIEYRFYHYSNASIQTPNSGFNMWTLSFGLWF